MALIEDTCLNCGERAKYGDKIVPAQLVVQVGKYHTEASEFTRSWAHLDCKPKKKKVTYVNVQ